MMSRKLNKISGVTLIELLVGVAVTALMMGAMFASYTAVNSSYKQVTDKARISSSSRDIVGMMMKDISCLLYTSPSPRDLSTSRMPSSA